VHHEPSIQDRFAPHGLCFGCGPNSDGGLHLRSYVAPAGDVVVARWRPEAQHSNAASPDARGVLNGGIIELRAKWRHLGRRPAVPDHVSSSRFFQTAKIRG